MAARPCHALALLPCLVLAATAAFGTDPSPAPLFGSDDLLEVTLDGPFNALMNDRPDEAELTGSFAWDEPDGTAHRVEVKLRTRGNYRRAKHHCDFAPLRLNFKKGDVAGTVFDGQDKLKLVTHCRTWEREFRSIILREYLAYRLFRELTDISYGVRLLRVTYFNTQSGNDYTRYGFVIEDNKAMSRRNDLKFAGRRFVSHDEYDRARQNLVQVFQYMIGNTEYSLLSPEPEKDCCHNADVLSADKTPPFKIVPFDFDFSGLVEAPYAQPNPKYPIKRVRTRYYKGLCANNDLLPATLDAFRDRREAIFSVIAELKSLPESGATAARTAQRYIEEFYEILDDPAAVEEKLVAQCRVPEEDEDAEV
jgi:hypothetical protein